MHNLACNPAAAEQVLFLKAAMKYMSGQLIIAHLLPPGMLALRRKNHELTGFSNFRLSRGFHSKDNSQQSS